MGSFGNLSAMGSGVTVTNYAGGKINNYVSNGATLNNAGKVNNSLLKGDSLVNNFGKMNNVAMQAGNGDNSVFNNFFGADVNNMQINVNSSNNTGFATVNNWGNVDNVRGHDHVDTPPAPPANRDLITFNNMQSGHVGNGAFTTSGIGQVDVFNAGTWGNLFGDGNIRIINA